MSGLNSLLMTGIDDEFPLIKFFPLNLNDKNILTELLIISNSYKKCGKGSLQSKNKIFYYRTYIPSLPQTNENNSSISQSFSDFYIYSYDCSKKKFFLIYYCDLNYNSKNIDNLTNKIFEILDQGAFEGHELKRESCNQINEIFEQSQKLVPKPKLSKNNQLDDINNINDSPDSINNVSFEENRNRISNLMKKRLDTRIIFPKNKVKSSNSNISVDIDDLTSIKDSDTDLSMMFKNNLDNDYYSPQNNERKKIRYVNIGFYSILIVIIIIIINCF